MKRLPLILCLLASPAMADVSAALNDHILPRHAQLAAATQALADSAQADCRPGAVRPVFGDAFDAWINVSHIQFGPLEDQALAIAMAFWPDTRDRVGKAITRLTAAQDPVVDDAEAFATVSAAAQGFTALERLLYDPQPDADYACRLTRAIATGLARKSAAINASWPAFAAVMQSAGEPGNTRFQSPAEAQRALYTTLTTGLEFLHKERLGRPLGTYERPRPRRAEARRSERTVRHILLSLAALEDLASQISDAPLPKTRAAFAKARSRTEALDDPALAGVSDPAKRFRAEVLQQQVAAIQEAVAEEIGTPLGIAPGFNALDGD